jgi:hypothetical protein
MTHHGLLEDRHRTLISILCAKEMDLVGYVSDPAAM